jgi:RNA polymerase I-specific transcription initiation factor RRN3
MVSLASVDRAAPRVVAPSIGSSLKLNVKRKHEDTDSDSELAAPSCPTKRLKVAFSPDVDVRILRDWNEKDTELIREEVRRTLERHCAGDKSGYDQLNHLISLKPTAEDAPSTPTLQKYLLVLTEQVGLLDMKSTELVHAILDCRWLTRTDQFVSTYIQFLGSLMSAQGGYASSILQRLVDYFIKRRYSRRRMRATPR